jgi:demethylmenaquinone methyltransferase/2-methoxy-6-polyprenyl-1,4-benzoquinol methylase
MFNAISPTYDRVNRILSFGLDQRWRKRMKKHLPARASLALLDCATGTGDQIIALMENTPTLHSAVGIDLADEMLAIGRKKIEKKPYAHLVTLLTGDALHLPFPENHFDCVTIAFGIRNVTDVMRAFQEFRRVLKPGGRVLILEGSSPSSRWLKKAHLFYLRHCLPYIGGMIARNVDAYRYLNVTLETFPQGEKLMGKMRAAGFVDVEKTPLWGGIATIYQGDKSDPLHH